jgi:short-subunit dehydrogenase
MKSTVDVNITSCLWWSSRLVKLVQESFENADKKTNNNKTKATLVNISSLLAIESFPTMGIYGAGKAARDHFHTTMAKEIG